MDCTSSQIIWFFTTLGFLIAFSLWKHQKGNKTTLNLPPSPRPLPFIGHIHLLETLLHRSLAKLSSKCGPLMFLRLGSAPAIVVSSPAMAREFLHTQSTSFAGRARFLASDEIMYRGKSLGSSQYGPVWKELRKLSTTELFTTKRIGSFMAIVQQELMELLTKALESSKSGELFQVRTDIRGFSFNVTTRLLMSKVYYGAKARDETGAEEAAEFVECVDELMEALTKLCISDMFPKLAWFDNFWSLPKLKKLHRKVDVFLQKTLEQHRENGNNSGDFVDILDKYFGLEKEEFTKATLLDLTLGGTDTSSTLIEWAMGELMNHPEVMRKAQQELENVIGSGRLVEVSDLSKLEYLNAVIKEAFRLHPPVPVLIHANPCACEVKGYHIPKDSIIFFNVHGIGRDLDPRVWENPEEFYPERFFETSINLLGNDFELIPFGAGRRMCVGLQLGLKNVQLTLANLLHGFNWSFPPGKLEHSMLEAFGLTSYMVDPLELKVTPRLADRVFANA